MSSFPVVGLGGSCHDFAACAVVEGRIVRAVADERLSRIRHGLDGSCAAPYEYVRGCVPPEAPLLANDMLEVSALPDAARRSSGRLLRHHLTHAAWAFWSSELERAAILVADGCGSVTRSGRDSHSRETTSWWLGSGTSLTLLGCVEGERAGPAEVNQMDALTSNSIGDLYQGVTMALGYSALQAGKTMALAAYGDDRYLDLFRDSIALLPHGQFALRLHADSTLLRRVTAIARRAREEADFGALASLAAACQHATEELLAHCLGHLAAVTGETALCFGGGVALNAVFNGKIRQRTPFRQVHVPFAPGDDGTALGAALLGHVEASGTRPAADCMPFLGLPYSHAECLAATRTLSESEFSITRVGDIAVAVARELSEGRLVAWFQGGSEFGPRALGSRSILAWPGDERVRDVLNRRVKGREWFRPFAPVVPASRVAELCEVAVESPFMQFAVPLRRTVAQQVPAVCHVDGSARVQTVRLDTSPLLSALLRHVESLLGLPVVLNTSLNGPGEPIVETPAEAVDCFARCGLDSLALGDLLVHRKTATPP